MNKITKYLVGGATAVALCLTMTPAALAWGPERPTFTNQEPADYPVFNSIRDNIVLGDERDFVRVVELVDEGQELNEYVNELEIKPGKRYGVFIYYHNNAKSKLNTAEYDYAGIAWNTRVATKFPSELKAGERGMISGIVSSTSTTPAKVWDEAYVTASEDLTLHFVALSAKLHNDWGADNTTLSTYLFDTEGALMGMDKLNGMVWGCYEYSGFVTYTIEARAVEGTTDNQPEQPDEEVPAELPNTGPVEWALAVVIVIVVVAGIVYWRKSSKEVKKTSRKAKGRK